MASTDATAPLSEDDKAARSASFGGVADLYERYRPGPTADVVSWFLPQPVDCVVDLGAGTGALTRLLAARAHDVVAVEPDERMRAVLAAEVSGARALAGRGEAIPVPDGSAQGVFASSSWHWMDPIPTLVEVQRVLTPGGVFGAVWTGPDPDGPFMRQAMALAADAGDREPGGASLSGSLRSGAGTVDRLELPAGVPFGPVEEQKFVWDIALNADELIGLLGTLSWVILLPDDERARLFATARRLLAELMGIEGPTTVDVAYQSVAFRTFRAGLTDPHPTVGPRIRRPGGLGCDSYDPAAPQEDSMTETTLEDFTGRATEFLDENAERRSEKKFVWGEGSDSVSMLDEKTPEQERAEVAEGKAWKQKEFDAGYGWISGPTEYGGQGLPAAYDRAYRDLAGQYTIPSQSPFGIGLGMVAPTILAHAIPEVREQYLRPLWRGEIIGCQLFSEPVAGSDLAGIQTKAEHDGDEWVVTGQKVWTSGTQYSDIGEIITRTSPDKPKHKGLSMFLVDMHAPGVEVRPLRQMTGGASFNEVFFEEVRVHDSHRLGDVDEGWTVALTTLMNERAAIGGGGAGVGSMSITRFVEMARHFGLSQDPLVRQGLAEAYIRTSVARYTNMRATAKIRAGQLPGPEMSIGKLALTQNMIRVGQLIGEILGPRLVADTGEWGTYAFSEMVLGTPGMRVAGGTDEVMRNIVGERVLGLPKEPRTS